LLIGTYGWWELVEPAHLSRIGQLVDQSPTTENLQTMSGIEYTDYERQEIEEEEIAGFLADYFQRDPDIRSVSEQERDAILEILDYVSDTFSSKKYVLGLAIDFILVAESLGEAVNPATSRSFEPELNGPDVINRYNRLETKKGQDLNTLTFLDDDGREHGIRMVENALQTLYHDGLDRLNYPSSAPYSTGQWSRYMDLLGRCFQLSDTGRRVAADELIDIGLAEMERTESFHGNPRTRLFPLVISDYPRNSIPGENAGAIFQGIMYGYVRADRPHLSTTVAKVRTGSARQKRIGDIDCYKDLNVELSVEVKDRDITSDNWRRELGTFRKNVLRGDILGVALVRRITNKAQAEIETDRLIVMTQADLLEEVHRWDWPKQDGALRDLIHYLAHIEQNPESIKRIQRFIHRHDPEHDILRNFSPETRDSSGQVDLQLE
jgi:hypothetical protein